MRFGVNVPQLVMRSLQIAKSSPPGPVYLMGAREVMESNVQPLDLKKIQPAKWKPLARQALDDDVTNFPGLTDVGCANYCGGVDECEQSVDYYFVCWEGSEKCPPFSPAGRDTGVRCTGKHWVVSQFSCLALGPSWVDSRRERFGRTHQSSRCDFSVRNWYISPRQTCVTNQPDVPWVPHHNKPLQETVVYHIDCDPLKEQMPMHYLYTDQSFRADGNLALTQLLAKIIRFKQIRNKEPRIQALKEQHEKRLQGYKEAEKPADVITVQYLSACIRDRLDDKSSIIINEATTNLKIVNDHLLRDEPGSFYSSPAAALGWSGGAAIAAKLAHPDKTVVTIAGDGSYLFTVPSTVHWMANRYNTPFLTIILNNRGWRAPKGSTLALYPHGQASIATADEIHCSIDPPPDYAGIARAASGGGALGIKVETPVEVIPALERALEAVKEGRQALLDVWLPKF
jgi:acetolactate synthase I/II/III large subunit